MGRAAETGGYNRLTFSHEDRLARRWFTDEARRLGLAVETDRNANLATPDSLVDNGDGTFTHTDINGGVNTVGTPVLNISGSPAAGISLTAGGIRGHTVTMAVDVDALADAIWTSIVGRKIVWDGTELCIDYNDNGDVNT